MIITISILRMGTLEPRGVGHLAQGHVARGGRGDRAGHFPLHIRLLGETLLVLFIDGLG